MGGFFGVTSKADAVEDVFFGTDYHSHLGTYRAGMVSWNESDGFLKEIHKIENSPFRTKFEKVTLKLKGNSCIGCIADSNPQPLLVMSHLGTFAITTIGRINNFEELIELVLTMSRGHFGALSKSKVNLTELVAALINLKDNFTDGIKFAQEKIDGSVSIAILREKGSIIVARDKCGRTPVCLGKDENGYCFSFENFAYVKLGYDDFRELGPGEIVELTSERVAVLREPFSCKHICAFLWTYYGYPNSEYEGVNVELMRARNGELLAEEDKKRGVAQDIDMVAGVPDSGIPHAIGYANKSKVPYGRPFIKYTPTWPRSFMPVTQAQRNRVAKMKQIPVRELIKDKKLLFVDDSIVRGTQLRETIEFLYENGAKEVHMRSACPPILFGCKYLNFSRNTSDMDLIARTVINELEGPEGEKYLDEYSDGNTERGRKLRDAICEKMHFASLEYQSLENVVKAIGLPKDQICTYCWDGEEND